MQTMFKHGHLNEDGGKGKLWVYLILEILLVCACYQGKAQIADIYVKQDKWHTLRDTIVRECLKQMNTFCFAFNNNLLIPCAFNHIIKTIVGLCFFRSDKLPLFQFFKNKLSRYITKLFTNVSGATYSRQILHSECGTRRYLSFLFCLQFSLSVTFENATFSKVIQVDFM